MVLTGTIFVTFGEGTDSCKYFSNRTSLDLSVLRQAFLELRIVLTFAHLDVNPTCLGQGIGISMKLLG